MDYNFHQHSLIQKFKIINSTIEQLNNIDNKLRYNLNNNEILRRIKKIIYELI